MSSLFFINSELQWKSLHDHIRSLRRESIKTMSSNAAHITRSSSSLLNLPAEIRNLILHYVFDEPGTTPTCLRRCKSTSALILNESYHHRTTLRPLLTSRQFHSDGHLLALSRTPFLLTTPFSDLPSRLSLLPASHLRALRSLTFVADARQFRAIRKWGSHPFGLADLRLEDLTLVLHRSSCPHYLFDFTADLVQLLRGLRGLRRWSFVRNRARVKGGFRTWFHRLVGLILKVDHQARFLLLGSADGRPVRERERVWWDWRFDEVGQGFELVARPPRPWVEEEAYMRMVLPLMEELREGVEREGSDDV